MQVHQLSRNVLLQSVRLDEALTKHEIVVRQVGERFEQNFGHHVQVELGAELVQFEQRQIRLQVVLVLARLSVHVQFQRLHVVGIVSVIKRREETA